jgi:hypothetical protein
VPVPRDDPARLKTPRHHLSIRPGVPRRRLAITLAGLMLLAASLLGFYTSLGLFNQAANTQPPAKPTQPVEVSGVVTDDRGNILVGAQVRVQGGSNQTTTNADGWYYLGQIPPGVYTLEASFPDHQTVTRKLDLGPGFPRTVDFALPPGSGTVEGTGDRISTFSNPAAGALALAVAVAVASAMAAAGGISAIRHRHYLLAVTGAAAGVLTLGFFLGTGLSIVALAILTSLRHGFREAEYHHLPWEEPPEEPAPEPPRPPPPPSVPGPEKNPAEDQPPKEELPRR